MYVRAKLHEITRSDVIDFARDNGIRRPDAIIRDVVASLKQFRTVATEYGVTESWIGRVESTIVEHLKAWGEWEYETADVAIDINGHTVSNMHVEQTYKGNFHLLAEIDGQSRKFVIGKNKEEYAIIESVGPANLTIEQLKEVAEKYLNL
jgi:serine/threonine-protein kinase HipA